MKILKVQSSFLLLMSFSLMASDHAYRVVDDNRPTRLEGYRPDKDPEPSNPAVRIVECEFKWDARRCMWYVGPSLDELVVSEDESGESDDETASEDGMERITLFDLLFFHVF